MANIEIQSQTEQDNGWAYEVNLDNNGSQHQYSVTLSRSDYDKWSQGQLPPKNVVKAAFEFLLERESASSIMSKFDCSVIRRYFPDVDRELPKKF
ncbi:MAG: hypothetical protein BRC47_12325 [Cyanobacteria bacterium QS_7_48_42]|jgi:hypothetical protein|nr:MAG: hypothetical protein BRC34_10705 [Cyanobacteria bacterium QH_1_48_107]PSO62200.1 MAG: hypothetical protein BRC36_10425 [Cyanobacteria bacterium QH_2_48_84]PSO64355.1 MAG: hypothetical protein BRC38_11675 [Cyanobacteria bacterium QH_6_48_35]PSO67013.1 MAG: hypothetical protein BRC42_17030 [Cyanobacteria bacterium QS_1_48_34]PSO78388.1 MAG: hypothetical protein BRC37_00890 [Cyanobacteria bacterium QH_3_48_40]PSO79602.1 MAG: hypothetical protein BRC45_15195 [Cyanobacteria bacterium QS_5_4